MTGRLNRLTARAVATHTMACCRFRGRVSNDKDGGLSLASAREKAGLHRRVLADGLDPLSEMRAAEVQRKAADTTFGSFADDYVTSHRPHCRLSAKRPHIGRPRWLQVTLTTDVP